ncbi:unnamed protein product [Protopolystoma xenopodis]|uniref:Uncharacterized protein n=1 Tax=Protopolystoma xenopodis TaxID=117903 RepID=A0A448XIK9_9PLAT|nr:unnamed protein product [Protopolystoma xenopodis]
MAEGSLEIPFRRLDCPAFCHNWPRGELQCRDGLIFLKFPPSLVIIRHRPDKRFRGAEWGFCPHTPYGAITSQPASPISNPPEARHLSSSILDSSK